MPLNGRHEQVLGIVADAGQDGLTWREVAAIGGINRGQASGALSNLLRMGKLIRMPTLREGLTIYSLHPEYRAARTALRLDSDAFDRGFALGLREGSATADEQLRKDSYAEGWAEGREALARHVASFLDEMTRAMQANYGVRITARTSTSWMRHPPHTIEVVRRTVEKSVGLNLTPPKYTGLPYGVVDLTNQREARK